MSESLLISSLEENRIILNKGNTPEIKLAKKRSWDKVVSVCKEKEGLEVSEKQLQKKWLNIKARVLEKLRKRNGTGGGPRIELSTSDERVLALLGEKNPKVFKVPGACTSLSFGPSGDSTERDTQLESNLYQEEEVDEYTACSVNKKARKEGEKKCDSVNEMLAVEKERVSIDRERLLLEKERLQFEKEKHSEIIQNQHAIIQLLQRLSPPPAQFNQQVPYYNL